MDILKRVNGLASWRLLPLLLLVPSSLAVSSSHAQEPGTALGIVSGRVVGSIDRRAIDAAVVELLGTGLRAQTDGAGQFTIEGAPPGSYSLRVRAAGYTPFTRSDVVVGSGKPVELVVALAALPIELEDIDVEASYFRSALEDGGGTRRLTVEEIRRTPGAQEDVVRTVALLPGVGVTTPGRNDLIVRGGAPFENLFLIDGIPIPNINHFGSQGSTGGPLSLVNIDLVADAEFAAGGFRARYGNRTASVTSITLREGSRRPSAELNLAATGFGAILEGPLGPATSFVFSARRSYLDLLFKAAGFSFIPAYWDFQLKSSTRVDANNSLSFLGIGAINTVTFNNDDADDRLDNSRILAPEQNQYVAGLSWQRLLPRGVLRVTAGRSFVRFRTAQRDTLSPPQEVFRNFSTEGENSLRVDLTLEPSRRLEVTAGSVSRVASRLRYDVVLNGDRRWDALGMPRPLTVDTSFTAWQTELYADASWLVARRLRVTAGGRASYYDFAGESFRLAPRIGVTLAFEGAAAVSLRLGRYYQAPSYIWLIGAPENATMLRPFFADQAVFGVEAALRPDMQLQVEAFYKQYRDYPARVFRPQAVLAPSGFEDVTTDIPFGLEPLTSDGRGRSFGVEVLVQKRLSEIPLYGLLSTSIARTEFTGSSGVTTPGAFDTRVIANAVLRYRASRAWELSGKFRIASGRPVTPFVTSGPDAGQLDFSRYNAERLPLFHALDVRVDRRWSFSGVQLEVYFDMQNVYGRRNVSQFFWNAREQMVEPDESLGVLPSIGVNVEF